MGDLRFTGSPVVHASDLEFTVMSPVVRLTDAAMHAMGKLMFSKEDYSALVIYVESGGCAGRRYGMSILLRANHIEQNKDLSNLCAIKMAGDAKMVVVRNDSLMFIAGMVIDYISTETGGGFKFSNPNASGACGCGESFSTKKNEIEENEDESTADTSGDCCGKRNFSTNKDAIDEDDSANAVNDCYGKESKEIGSG